jgi:hypothetical protein
LGTVFAIGTDGNNYSQLYAFGPVPDGNMPQCTLALSGNTLCGTTSAGGSNSVGTLFTINTDGTDYQIVQNFAVDGANPVGSLALSGTNVFGITTGGQAGAGTVFELGLPTPAPTYPAPFFAGEVPLPPYTNGWYWMGPQGANTYGFGYFNTANFPYVLHNDMGWEYFIDANDAGSGGYFYDFTDEAWFYTTPGLFPYLYDFNQNAWVYYLPESSYIYSSSPRWFDNLSTLIWSNDL